MLKRLVAVATLVLVVTLAGASDRDYGHSGPGNSVASSGIGEMHRYYSRGREVRLYIRRQLRQGSGNLSHWAWLERTHVCGY